MRVEAVARMTARIRPQVAEPAADQIVFRLVTGVVGAHHPRSAGRGGRHAPADAVPQEDTQQVRAKDDHVPEDFRVRVQL